MATQPLARMAIAHDGTVLNRTVYGARMMPDSRSICLAAILCIVFAPGCIHRRMTILSNPPGAQVLVDGEPIGYTPTSLDFTYYGTREITLVKDGYQSVNVLQKLKMPWYQVPPVEFVTDNLWPMKIRDRHVFSYTLEPQRIEPTNDLIDRAESLRNQARGP